MPVSAESEANAADKVNWLRREAAGLDGEECKGVGNFTDSPLPGAGEGGIAPTRNILPPRDFQPTGAGQKPANR
jgi:hypothetical protein